MLLFFSLHAMKNKKPLHFEVEHKPLISEEYMYMLYSQIASNRCLCCIGVNIDLRNI